MVFGLPRRTSIALVGWLWADILLGLMALFLAANSAGTAVQSAQGIDPRPLTLELTIDGPKLLGGSSADVTSEQRRVADQAKALLDRQAKGRRVAVVLAYARQASPAQGDTLAKLATADLTTSPFDGSVIKLFHELDAGNAGDHLTLEIYLYQ